MSKENTIQILCQSNDNDELRIVSTSQGMRVGVVFNGNLAGTIIMGRTDAQRLEKFIATEYAVPLAPAPRAPVSAVHKTIAGLGGKELVFDAGNSTGQTTLAISDGYTIHHIVLNEQAVAELHTLVSKEVFRFSAPDAPAHLAPAAPDYSANPGTMVFDGDDDTKVEVSLAQENLTVAIGHEADFGWEFVHLNQANVDALIKHLQHCRHHMHGLVRVKEVPMQYTGGVIRPTYVVSDMDGAPRVVLQSEPDLAQYLSTNKLRVAQ